MVYHVAYCINKFGAVIRRKRERRRNARNYRSRKKRVIDGETSVEATQKAMDHETHIITVADREADIFELFVLPRADNMDLLIRATQDRCVQGEDPKMKKLWERVEAGPEATETIATHLEHKPGIAARDVT